MGVASPPPDSPLHILSESVRVPAHDGHKLRPDGRVQRSRLMRTRDTHAPIHRHGPQRTTEKDKHTRGNTEGRPCNECIENFDILELTDSTSASSESDERNDGASGTPTDTRTQGRNREHRPAEGATVLEEVFKEERPPKETSDRGTSESLGSHRYSN